jgi:hypothetical protein
MDIDLVVVAGATDPNTPCILAAARATGMTVAQVTPSPESEPAVSWDPATGTLWLDGDPVHARGAFLRYDVFGPGGALPGRGPMDQGRADRALGWYSTLASWAMADDAVRAFNRATEQRAGLKGYAIARAAALGVPVPATRLTNDRAAIAVLGPPEALIAKPAGGGSYCRPVDALVADAAAWPDGRAPAPAIVQDRLDYPEVRVFLIGGTPFVFETTARTLDFRSDRASVTTHAPPSRVPPALMARLQALARDLRLDFCAFDLKTRAGGGTGPLGDLVFLEVNSGPMFSAFDALAGGALAQAMVRWLVTGRAEQTDRPMAAE